jgi:hypothetical protein
LKVIAADSGAAILNDRFEPLCVVAAASVLVEPPYREASHYLAEPIFADMEKGPHLIIHELDLCQKLLKEVKADVVHLDMSLGGLNLEELSPIQLSEMKISSKAKKEILGILPKIRKFASGLKQTYGIDIIAIGKESIPVRIAELTSGAHAILYASEKAIMERTKVRVGLPINCQQRFSKDGVTLQSLMPIEYDVKGYAKDEKKVLEKVRFSEMLNPCVRGFCVLEIIPKKA